MIFLQFNAIRGPFAALAQFLAALDQIPRKGRTLLIGLDGCGGSGKSTCARLLAAARPDVTTVQMDDFYRPSADRLPGPVEAKPIGADFDWERVRRQVLEPISQDQEGRYQRYDWPTDRLSDTWERVPVGGILVVEGVHATRNELAPYYDFRIWVECPRHLRLARGLERDGLEARDRWEKEWMVAEDRYVAAHAPALRADLVLDGSC